MSTAWMRDYADDHDDLAEFVDPKYRHRSLTVVLADGDVDQHAAIKQWMDKVTADTGDMCLAMSTVLCRWADGSRNAQRAGSLALVRLDSEGHKGLGQALDALWSVRTKDARDWQKLVESARDFVTSRANPHERTDCVCRPDVPVTNLAGLMRHIIIAPDERRDALLRWAVAKAQRSNLDPAPLYRAAQAAADFAKGTTDD